MMDTFADATGEHASVKVVESFCLAATNEGKSVVELAKLAGSTRTTMSRHLMDLSEMLRNGKDGYKLLQRNQDPRNMRTVFYTLTPKGHKLSRKLKELMED
jgi:DNA-binding MarR family transcriptional regulator